MRSRLGVRDDREWVSGGFCFEGIGGRKEINHTLHSVPIP